jgi:N-acyl homoserine lactone hydrolase
MRKIILGLLAACAMGMAAGAPAQERAASAGPEIWRLDCGEIHVSNLDVFSDAYLYVGQEKTLTSSCYLIRHGERYLLWDTGLSGELEGRTNEEGVFRMSLRERIVPQLARIGVRPEQISFVGISHYHFDHTGQVADFPNATLLVGTGDWDVLRGGEGPANLSAPFRHWIEGGGAVRPVAGDIDIFRDGTVVMLNLPGHTPGHHGLLVRLASGRNLLLSGDQFHFTEQVANNGVPSFNTNRADTLASSARLLTIADSLEAEIIIQHEPADIARLPSFPESAR